MTEALKRIQDANKKFTRSMDSCRTSINEWGQYWLGVFQRGYLLPHEEKALGAMMSFLIKTDGVLRSRDTRE